MHAVGGAEVGDHARVGVFLPRLDRNVESHPLNPGQQGRLGARTIEIDDDQAGRREPALALGWIFASAESTLLVLVQLSPGHDSTGRLSCTSDQACDHFPGEATARRTLNPVSTACRSEDPKMATPIEQEH